MTDHRTIHRCIPAAPKHQAMTACGIKLYGFIGDDIGLAEDGGNIAITYKGKPFDCKRCRSVLEQFHAKVTA